MGSQETNMDSNGSDEQEFLYAVLNLPTTATAYDIRERHRSLSVIFHPDKQKDDRTKETATKRFYEIQRAYEVLSDPFLRAVYDELGEAGLRLKLGSHLRRLSGDELKKALRDVDHQVRIQTLEAEMHSQGRVTCGFDLRQMFVPGRVAREWYNEVPARMRDARLSSFGVRHSISKDLNPEMRVSFAGFLNQGGNMEALDSGLQSKADSENSSNSPMRLRGNVTGSLRYQHRPNLKFEGATNFLRRPALQLSTVYDKDASTYKAQTTLSPSIFSIPKGDSSFSLPFPPLNLSLTRRLFPHSLTEGTVALNIPALLAAPHVSEVSVSLNKPIVLTARQRLKHPFSTRADHWSPPLIGTGWSCGLQLRILSGGPGINFEYGIVVPSLALNLRIGSQLSILAVQLANYIGGDWSSDDGRTGVGALVAWGAEGVTLRLSLTHLGQTLVVPLVLATEANVKLELFATVLPGTVYALSNYFFLAPRRKAKRLERRRAIQDQNDEHISRKRREAEDAMLLLSEVAKRRMSAERERNGLVILEATYVPVDNDDWSAVTGREESIMDLAVDVTVAVQALVQNGQLFIPGNRSKAHLQGFYDPLPEYPKRLWIRYEFRGRTHYTEAGDLYPVVLPMRDHLIDKSCSNTLSQ